MLAKIKLEQDKNSQIIHRLFVNGIDFSKNVCHVELHAMSIPVVTIELSGSVPEFEGEADVKYDFTPETIEQAVKVLRNELLKREDLYEGFHASIVSALKDLKCCVHDVDSEVAYEILRRIIGEEG